MPFETIRSIDPQVEERRRAVLSRVRARYEPVRRRQRRRSRPEPPLLSLPFIVDGRVVASGSGFSRPSRSEARTASRMRATEEPRSQLDPRLLRIMYDPTYRVEDTFYDFLRTEGVRPTYGRFLREGLRRGDGALSRSGVAAAIRWLHAQFPRMHCDRNLERTLNVRVARVEQDAIDRTERAPATHLLRQLERNPEPEDPQGRRIKNMPIASTGSLRLAEFEARMNQKFRRGQPKNNNEDRGPPSVAESIEDLLGCLSEEAEAAAR